jgi:O-antigen/teichoic acid export membrane protein
MMSLQDVLVKNALWLFSAEIIDKLLSYFLIVVLARTLGDIGLGEYSFVFAFAGLTFLLADFGVGYYLLRESARSPQRIQTLFSNILSVKLLLVLLAFGATLAFLIPIDKPAHVLWSIIILSAILSLQHLGNLFESIFQGRNRMHLYAIPRVLERLVAFAVGIIVLLKFKNLSLFFIVLLIAYLFRFFYELIFARKIVKLRPRFDLPVIKEVLKAGIPLWTTGVFAFIYFRIDIVMLSLLVNDQVVGWYSAAYKLIDALNFIPYIIFVATFPSMSLLFQKNRKLLKILLNRVIRSLVALASPLVIGTILLADRILLFIYGDQFTNSTIALQILIIAQAIAFITYILGTSLNAMNREKAFTLVLASLAVFNLVLNFIFIPRYSYVGASITTVMTEVLSLVILHALMKKTLVPIRYKLLKPLVAAAVMGVALYLLRPLAIWWLIPLGMILYFCTLALLGIEHEDKVLLQQLLKKLHVFRTA